MQDEPSATQAASRAALDELIALRKIITQFGGCTSVTQTGQPYSVHWRLRDKAAFEQLRTALVHDYGYAEVRTDSDADLSVDPCTLLPRHRSTTRCYVFEKSNHESLTVRATIELFEADTEASSYEAVLSALKAIIPPAVHGLGNVFETDNVSVFDLAERYVVTQGFSLLTINSGEPKMSVLTYARAALGDRHEVVQLWFYPSSATISVREALYYPDKTTGEYVRYGGAGAVTITGDAFEKMRILRRFAKDNPSVSEYSCVWRVVLQ